MVEPGLVVDAVGELEERHEVVGLEVQPLVRSAEVEAPVGPEVALCVLAVMPAMLGAWTVTPKRERGRALAGRPEQRLARAERDRGPRRNWLPGGLAEATDHFFRRVAHGEDDALRGQHGGRHV